MMKQYDYLIVGFGLAGMAMAAVLEKYGKTYRVIDNNPNLDTRVVGGMYNPIILKRFTPAWQADEMWRFSKGFYEDMEAKFQKQYLFPANIRRIIHNTEEQNNWVVASDKPVMSSYMNPKIMYDQVNGIKTPFGFGELHGVGRVAGEELLKDYKSYLIEKGLFTFSDFKYSLLEHHEYGVKYQDIKFNKIIFSEGSYVLYNPFFNEVEMKPAKGEMLVLKIPELTIDFTIKSGVFLVPLGDNLYITGATYNWEDITLSPTDEAQFEIEEKLKSFLSVPYEIVARKIGIRPTVKDRRPVIGIHPSYKNMALLNGLGTRGVIIAPYLAQTLYKHMTNAQKLPQEMDIQRFYTIN